MECFHGTKWGKICFSFSLLREQAELLDNALQEYLEIIGMVAGGVRNADCGKPSGIDYAS
ncbi:hypothetical protein WN48_01153 [Eufriesea mexicana]|nr:hypothetical protein WN48_01153 [Eufriesea mexicana]